MNIMKKISDILCGGGIAMCAACLIAAGINHIANPWLIVGACGSLVAVGVGHSIRKAVKEERERLD